MRLLVRVGVSVVFTHTDAYNVIVITCKSKKLEKNSSLGHVKNLFCIDPLLLRPSFVTQMNLALQKLQKSPGSPRVATRPLFFLKWSLPLRTLEMTDVHQRRNVYCFSFLPSLRHRSPPFCF